MNRIKKYEKNLERVKHLVTTGDYTTKAQIAINLHVDNRLIQILVKNKILVLEAKPGISVYRWSKMIPVTSTLAETIITLMDEYYNTLPSRQVEPEVKKIDFTEQKKRFKKIIKKSKPSLLRRIWIAIWNN